MKKTLTTIALSITGLVSFAQQDAQFSMNMFNRLSVNPAYAGTSEALCGTLLYRQQWTNFPGAPKTGLFSLDFGRVLGGGVGLTVDQDQLGFEKTLKAKLAYSFHLAVGPGVLGIGLDAGMIQKSVDGTKWLAPDGSTSATGGTDQAIPWGGAAATTYDVGFGLYYTTKKLYVGISSLHLPEQTLSKSGGANSLAYNFDYKVARHYYVMAGYTFDLNENFKLTPSTLVKSDASSTQVDINMLLKWNNMVFIGASYRLTDAIPIMAGLEWPMRNNKSTLKFGYSYDMTLSAIKNHSSGTHEIMLGFCQKFKKEPKPQGHMNVRFL
ncbi:MAG: type IX secretion system membrane protein PorP/SprF [Bacteroidia bacterium]|nr:type IX secretion system membrane protein PorP/SprF [Bacteroidia bacterium]